MICVAFFFHQVFFTLHYRWWKGLVCRLPKAKRHQDMWLLYTNVVAIYNVVAIVGFRGWSSDNFRMVFDSVIKNVFFYYSGCLQVDLFDHGVRRLALEFLSMLKENSHPMKESDLQALLSTDTPVEHLDGESLCVQGREWWPLTFVCCWQALEPSTMRSGTLE